MSDPKTIPYKVETHGFDVKGQVPVEHPITLYKEYPSAPPTMTPIANRVYTILHIVYVKVQHCNIYFNISSFSNGL